MSTPASRRLKRRIVLPGFPVDAPFTEATAVWEYLNAERIVCLRCGQKFRRLGGHLEQIHDWTVEEYKDFYGLPVSGGRGLVSKGARKAYSEASRIKIAKNREAFLTRLDGHRGVAVENARAAPRRRYRATISTALGLARHFPDPRPNKIPPESWKEFLRRMAKGRTPAEVCQDPDMPAMTAVHERRSTDAEFSAQFDEVWGALPFAVQARAQKLGPQFAEAVGQMRAQGLYYYEIADRLGVHTMTAHRHDPTPTPR